MKDPRLPRLSARDKTAAEEEESALGPESPSRFAIPESSRGRRHGTPVVIPESNEEDEETLIAPSGRPLRERERLETMRYERRFILLLFVLAALAVLGDSGEVGMSWDEPYYVDAARRTNAWIAACLGPGRAPVRETDLERFWDADRQEPRGHPSVTRFLVGLGMMTAGGNPSPLAAMRRPIAFCFALTIVALYLLVRRTHGRVTAWLTVVAYFFMPRIFGHAHFAATETPMAMMTVLVVYAFLRGLESGRWAALTGLFLGLALATKINALALPLILLPWAFLFHRRASLNNLYAMLFLAPPVMALVWPWLWRQPLPHFLQYLAWNFEHKQTGTLYFGRVYDSLSGPAPWHYPLVLLALSLPLTTLGLAILGVARTIRAPRRHYFGLLYLWAAALPCLVQMGPAAPKYDGVRLFLSAFPFVAVLAGIGGSVLVRIGAFFSPFLKGRRFSPGMAALTAITILVIVNGGWALLSVRPYYLSFFNQLIGGPRGALEKGMEVAYWGEALNRKALDVINEKIPDGATLMPRAMNINVLRCYQQWGWLKPGIRLVEDRGPVDYQLLHYRRSFFTDSDVLLERDYAPKRTAVFGLRDAPAFGLYRTGVEFEEYRRRAGGT